MKKSYLLAGLVLLAASPAFAQLKVGAAGAPDASAMLEVTSGVASNKGLLLPRMTTVQRNGITSPATGLMIYNTTTNESQVNTGTPAVPIWTVATATATGWNTNGNTGTTPATNFIGTADSQAVVIRTNNTEKMRVTPAGNLGVGITNPLVKLHVRDTGDVTMLIGTPNGNRGHIALGNMDHGLVRNLTSSGGEANDVALYTTSGNAVGAALYLVSDPTNSNDSLPLDQFVLRQTGNIGIGIKDPTSRLHVNSGSLTISNNGPIASSAISVISDNGGGLNPDNINITTYGTSANPLLGTSAARGTLAAPLNSQSGDNIGGISFGARVNGAFAIASGINATYFGDSTNVNSRLSFSTSGQTQMTIGGTGRVGIGTATPATKLHVTDTGNVAIRIGSTNGGSSRLDLGDNNIFHGVMRNLSGSGGAVNDIALYTSSGIGTPGSLYLTANPTATDILSLNQFVLKNTGNVGIGTGDPHNRLDLGTTIGSSITDPAGKKLALTNNATGTNFYGLGVSGSTLQFHTGSGTTSAPLMVLVSNGSVGIGINTPAYNLDVAGDINASNNVRAGGVVLTSDARLKRNITNSSYGLNTIMDLRPVVYDKKNSIRETNYDRHEIGFIAQEIAKVLPGLVTEGKDADKTLAVSYTELIPVLTKAIQEQQAEIEALKAGLAAAKTDNTALKAEISKIETLDQKMKQLEALLGTNSARSTTASK